MEEDRLNMVLGRVEEVIVGYQEGLRQLAGAVANGDAAVRQAEAGLRRALRGIPLSRWEALSTRKSSPRAARVARELHQVAGSRHAVEAAMKALAAARVARDVQVREAATEFADVLRRLAGYGRLAERVTGLQGKDLRRMIRSTGSASGEADDQISAVPTDWRS